MLSDQGAKRRKAVLGSDVGWRCAMWSASHHTPVHAPSTLSLSPSLSLSLSLALSLLPGASIAQLVESRSWIRKALSSILASAASEWVTKKFSPQSLRRKLKREIPKVFRISAAPVQE